MKVVPEWLAPLTLICMIGLGFETVTGLFLYLAPFSQFNQYGVLLHTAIGLLWTIAFIVYSVRHWLQRYSGNFNHVQLLGYVSFVLILVCIVTGVWLTVEAAFGTRITYAWSSVHLYTGLGLILAMLAHMAVVWKRDTVAAPMRVKYQFLSVFAVGTIAILGIQAVTSKVLVDQPVHNEFPADYKFPFGSDNPFAPSLGHTETNGAYDAVSMSGSHACGSSGCHDQILAEWEASAHRYSAADLAFQAVEKLMVADVGAEGTRYCAGCHDPIALFSGHKNTNVEGLTSVGSDEGVSCVACHAITATDVRGNADYTITQPARYLGEYRDTPFSKWISDFLIRAYPEQHKSGFARALYKTPEYCAACHKQFIDEQVNQLGWVQLQNQYDNWLESRWHHEDDATKSTTCRECHMRLVDSHDPAAGDSSDYNRRDDDGKHRSHRFLAANQVMPLLLQLPGAQQHVELTEQWLRGEIPIPEIADKWTSGPVITLDIDAPEVVRPGEQVSLNLVITNNKTGHGFPTGPLDIIRSWVEITVRDSNDMIVYETGKPDASGAMTEGTVIFKADGIDRYGKDIDRHNLWEMVGARFKRVLFPGMEDSANYSFFCPEMTGVIADANANDSTDIVFSATGDDDQLTVTANLMYQKADAEFMDRLFGAEANLRTPTTVISSKSVSVRVAAE